MTIVCENCGSTAEKKAHNAKFCSMPCAQRKHFLDHREEHLAKWRRYYARNRKRLTQKTIDYLAAHPERTRETNRTATRRYYNTPKGKASAVRSNSTRRTRHLGGGPLDYAAWRARLRECGSSCAMCGRQGKMSIDHILPIAKGGTNEITNLQPLCMPCNRSKGVKILPGTQMALLVPHKVKATYDAAA